MNGTDLLCGDAGGDARVGGGHDVADAFGDIGDIRLSKKRKELADLFMLLPLNTQGLLREAPITLTTANKMVVIAATAK